jgi:hypothetical protein
METIGLDWERIFETAKSKVIGRVHRRTEGQKAERP